jgi:predicted NUDIX family NTP pyrophosphohydrolase
MARTSDPIEPNTESAGGPTGSRSAGLLVYRRGAEGGVDFLLGHPGGPYWRNKDLGAWSIPKGLIEPGEDALAAARREFQEEVGLAVEGDATPLTPQRQRSGKIVSAWMIEADLDLAAAKSADFEMEWPPRSGTIARFPEIDRWAYFRLEPALEKIHAGQRAILIEAVHIIDGSW